MKIKTIKISSYIYSVYSKKYISDYQEKELSYTVSRNVNSSL